MVRHAVVGVCCLAAMAAAALAGEGEVELVDGDRVPGIIIEETDDHVLLGFEAAYHTRLEVPWEKVHAITHDGERRVINDLVPAPLPPPPSEAELPPGASRGTVDARITMAGFTPPDWWEATKLDHPETLDLTWDDSAGWDVSRTMGVYVWDVVNPNPRRWRPGVRMMHRSLQLVQDDPEKTLRSVQSLAIMHQNLLQDWARAAFWWQRLDELREPGGLRLDEKARLAECYRQLGSATAAAELIAQARNDYTGDAQIIKLWAAMGQIDRALAMAEARAAVGMTESAWHAAGDACRLHGRYADAVAYYEKAIAVARTREEGEVGVQRAQSKIDAVRLLDALDVTKVRDGVYRAADIGYNGPVHVEVEVAAGRISSVSVTGHEEKQFYAAITDTTAGIVREQGIKGVDATTGATVTSNAIMNATAKALATGNDE